MANVQSSTLISSMFTQNCCLALNTIQAMRNCDQGTAQNLYANIKPHLSRELKTVKRSAGRGGKPHVVFCTLQEATYVLGGADPLDPDSLRLLFGISVWAVKFWMGVEIRHGG